ncbi:S-adenosyl-L-methionine-dependent methyltransferase [Pterulicium gracile]|uniref:S-adenosyl-L-methionine-dependent methyltransferase n=1 Tax=Pterulicium gracile TaxID=1884261 RepID=A0A5C3QUX2_9AGAR|nr:S-adenosyl-L-methionine-dependent methyltransferase [Pterula gracilis]
MHLRRAVQNATRSFASHSSPGVVPNQQPHVMNAFQVFDRNAKKLQKDRSVTHPRGSSSTTVDYLRDEVADRLMERLHDIKREFKTLLDLGSGPGHFSKLLEANKVGMVTMLDSSAKLLHRDPDSEFEVPVERIHADEERLLEAIPPNSQEAIVSCLNLHWVNDLPGVLVQAERALKPDGVFMCAMFGGETLFELRTALQLAEVDREGGISPHVSPMTQSQDMSNLLTRAEFKLTAVDVDEVQITYPSMWELLDDIRSMGESNAIIGRRNIIHRDTLTAASAIYKALHGNPDGTIPATFQIIYMIGWKYHPSQRPALKRGAGKVNMQDIL